MCACYDEGVSTKRQNTRHDLELTIAVTVDGSTHQLSTRNLSLGGVFVVATFMPSFNARVKISLPLPTQREPILIEGTVRWSNDEGFAVQFDGLRAKDVYTLGKFFEG